MADHMKDAALRMARRCMDRAERDGAMHLDAMADEILGEMLREAAGARHERPWMCVSERVERIDVPGAIWVDVDVGGLTNLAVPAGHVMAQRSGS